MQDLIGEPYSSRSEVEGEILRIIGSWDTNRSDGEFSHQRNIRDLSFLRALREKNERFSPINDYLLTTMGLTFTEGVDTLRLDAQNDRVSDCAKDVGFNWDENGWKEYLQNNQITIQDFVHDFSKGEFKLMPPALEYLGLKHLVTSGFPFYKITKDCVDAPWVAWASGGRKNGFDVKINTHLRNMSRLIKGAPERFYIHEVLGHGLQHLGYMDKIDKQLINPVNGITLVPGPEQFGLEGSAITAPFLIPPLLEKMSPHAYFDTERSILEEMVKLNAIIALNNAGDNSDVYKITKEMVVYYLPSETNERINTMFEKMTKDIVWRSYFVAYAEGALFLRQVADDLLPESRKRLAKAFYEKPRTPGQIEQLVKSLKARDNNDEDGSLNVKAA